MNKMTVCIIANEKDSLYTAETPKHFAKVFYSPGQEIIDDKSSSHELKYSWNRKRIPMKISIRVM